MDTQDQTKPALQKQKRERTQIEFPYTDMSQAEELTRVLFERGGGTAEPTQLAGWMDQSANGGSFRSRMSAARMFGFVDTERGGVTITQLGRNVLEPMTAPGARVVAFLRVPLFEAMYDKFNGYALPPAAAIERQAGELGVPKKQCERARQVFQKSAVVADFIDANSGRFVKPALARVVSDAEKKEEKKGGSGGGGGDGEHHPFIDGLLKTLPKTGENWDVADRAKWLTLAANAFDLIFKAEDDRIVIVEVKSKSNGGTG